MCYVEVSPVVGVYINDTGTHMPSIVDTEKIELKSPFPAIVSTDNMSSHDFPKPYDSPKATTKSVIDSSFKVVSFYQRVAATNKIQRKIIAWHLKVHYGHMYQT